MNDDCKSHISPFFQKEDIEESELVKLIHEYQKTEDFDLREKLINGQMNFINKQCNTFQRIFNNLDFGEVLSAVFAGVDRALLKYDSTKNTKFSTYAIFWIRAFLANQVVENFSKIKISAGLASKINILSGLVNNDENISNEAIAERLNVSLKKVKELKDIKDCMGNFSIDAEPYVQNQMELSLYQDNLSSYDPEFIDECLNELTEREALILRERYGLNDGNQKTLQEISNKVDVTAERVRQIIKKTLPKLQTIYTKKMKEEDGIIL